MKKLLIIIPLIALLSSCGTLKPTTAIEQPTIILTDSNFCISGGLSISVSQDSLFLIFEKGFVVGKAPSTAKIYWQSSGTSDPFNGRVIIESNLCISGTDFCLTGNYFVQVHQSAFLATLNRGLTLGTPATSVFIKYSDGKLSIRPTVCIKTKVTAKSLN